MTNPPVSPFTRGANFVAPCVAAALCSLGHLQAALVNPGFETGDLSGWSTLGTVAVSTGKTYSDTVDVSPGASRIVAPNPGSFLAHLIASSEMTASEIALKMRISEATLEGSNDGIDAAFGSLISQTVSAAAGDKFTFNWNFVERDYAEFNEWSFFGVSFNDGPSAVSRLASVIEVGPVEDKHSANTTVNGWKTFEYEIAAAGNYTFHFGVVNANDRVASSELWVDAPESSISGTGISTIPEPGSVLGLGLLLGSGRFVRSRRRAAQNASV